MSVWERGRELDRRMFGWMWDEDAKVRWWLWLILAVVPATRAWSNPGSGWGLTVHLVAVAYCLVRAVVRFMNRP